MLSRIRAIFSTKWHILAAAFGFAAALGGIAYSQGYILPSGATVQSHFYTSAQGAPPTCINCSIQAGSTDFFGQASVTSTGGIQLTFGTPFTNTPWCIASDNTTIEGVRGIASTTAVQFVGGVTSDLISWVCVGH